MSQQTDKGNSQIQPMTDQEMKDFLAWAIVKPETHTEVQCKCPECFAVFTRWFQNHMVECPHDKLMHSQTTECSFCHDERLADEEDEELFSKSTDE